MPTTRDGPQRICYSVKTRMRWVKEHRLSIAIAAAALLIALMYVYVVLQHAAFGLPIEDGYIYLTYAKQFGRGQPFTYFPGGGYSAGSTSAIWPMLLAPFWALGARGVALVYVSFAVCACFYAATVVLCGVLVRRIYGALTSAIAAGFALGVAPFAFTALSGMEVALASFLFIAATCQLYSVTPHSAPSKKLLLTLACLALSRPEAMVVVTCIVTVRVFNCVRGRAWRATALWLISIVPTLLWLSANRALAGNWFPNTGIAKSHFYLPGFDWTYWWQAVTHQTGSMLAGLFWKSDSPFVAPKLFALAWLVGAVRVTLWAVRAKKLLVGTLIVFAPLGIILAVIASSGAWTFHNYRYIAPAFPLLATTAACAIAPRRIPERFRWAAVCTRAWPIVSAIVLVAFACAAFRPMRDDMDLYAQDVTDLNRQVVTLGRYIHEHTPNASIMFHDAGAIAYYGDTRVYDMLGLVTNGQARVANNGPGSRFEFLESLPPEQRPTYFAYYPSWMGQNEFYGDIVLQTPLAPPFHHRRLIGAADMQLIVARWDRAHTAEQPLVTPAGWHVVDRVDVADIASEDEHAWVGALGRRAFGDPTARWSVFHRDEHEPQPLLDGGRTIRGGTERFTVTVDPGKPVRLLMRTGGEPAYPYNDRLDTPVEFTLSDDSGAVLGRVTLPAPTGPFVEVPFEFQAAHSLLHLTTRAPVPYRIFHWFALQPDSP